MTWNHRVIKKKHGDTYYYGIHEVYYNPDGTIYAATEEPVSVACEEFDDLQEILEWMTKALSAPVLNYEDLPEI